MPMVRGYRHILIAEELWGRRVWGRGLGGGEGVEEEEGEVGGGGVEQRRRSAGMLYLGFGG